jgi:integrase/recombinase XerD
MKKRRAAIQLPAAISDYLESLRVRHYSPDTVYYREGELRRFWIYLQSIGVSEFREVTQRMLENYHRQAWHGLTSGTVRLNLDTLRFFFDYLENLNLILLNPCLWLAKPRKEHRLPRYVLKPSEVRVLLDAPNQRPRGLRDRAIMELFYSSGIRRAEMTRLTLQDVDIKNGVVRVIRGKGGKDRVVPIGQSACEALTRYLKGARAVWLKDPRTPQQTNALWLDAEQPHTQLCKERIGGISVEYAKKVLGRNISSHIWRHSCATHLVANGANLVYVQRLLGHKSLDTTQIYTRVSVPDLKKTLRRAHPRVRRTTTPPPSLTRDDAALMPGGNRHA